MRKKYSVKNYKGNIVESLGSFKKKYPKMKIVEATEANGGLTIVAEDDNNIGQNKAAVAKAQKHLPAILNSIVEIIDDFTGNDNGGKVSDSGGSAIGFLEDLLDGLLEEDTEQNPSITTESSDEKGFDFYAAYLFLRSRRKGNLLNAFNKVYDALGEAGDLDSAINQACDEQEAAEIRKFFNAAYPSALEYRYNPSRGWDGDPDVLDDLFDLAFLILKK